jgi:hypothetical protein
MIPEGAALLYAQKHILRHKAAGDKQRKTKKKAIAEAERDEEK